MAADTGLPAAIWNVTRSIRRLKGPIRQPAERRFVVPLSQRSKAARARAARQRRSRAANGN